jgi:colanic acid biosynthesis glycosyl transferase WcaI
MKIIIHTMYFLPEFGSAPILMNELASFLASRGHEVDVVTTMPRPPHNKGYRGRIFKKESKNGLCLKRYLTNSTSNPFGRLVAWSIYTFWTTINLLSVKKGDILFLRLPPLQLGITGIMGSRLKKAKILLNVQDIHPDLSIESGILRNRIAIKMAAGFEKWIYKKSKDIAVISEGFKKNLENKDVDPSKIAIIPNWVDTDFLKPLPKDNTISRKYSLTDKFVIMYSGTISISSIQTLEKILESAELVQNDSDILFVIVGEGLKKAELERKARELDLKNILFLSFQPYENLPSLLASADILLVPLDEAKSHLSVPSKLYNFMAAGRPILGLAHSDSEVKRIIEDTQCGMCVPPGDIKKTAETITSLKEAKEHRETLGANGRKYAEDHYAKDKVLRQFEELMESL